MSVSFGTDGRDSGRTRRVELCQDVVVDLLREFHGMRDDDGRD